MTSGLPVSWDTSVDSQRVTAFHIYVGCDASVPSLAQRWAGAGLRDHSMSARCEDQGCVPSGDRGSGHLRSCAHHHCTAEQTSKCCEVPVRVGWTASHAFTSSPYLDKTVPGPTGSVRGHNMTDSKPIDKLTVKELQHQLISKGLSPAVGCCPSGI